ncbi:B12-binding domain-containing protein [Pelagibius sp.]|uniref:cobalamin B12-binding domain-containing protein n=1 Tax=Pelagibius sp. TaxID=1931238 RepID=UPI00262F140C|nr:cobalamin-dependent protein [Pelagibius sp.]
MASFRDEGQEKDFFGTEEQVRNYNPPPADFSHVAAVDGSDVRFDRLVKTIEGEIIPRLVLAHKTTPPECNGEQVEQAKPCVDDITELTSLVLKSDATMAQRYVDLLRERGVALESIFLDLLAPAAKHLGELWKQDLCTFTDVTIGLGRLQQILRNLSFATQGETIPWQQGRRALIAPAPGEQHNFGALMVAEFLRRAGWDVMAEPVTEKRHVADLVRQEWYAVLGLSLSCDDGLEALAAEINEVRRVSRNESLSVIVGGRVFVEHPKCVTQVGADAMAVDGHHAALQADSLHTLVMAHC